MEEETFDIKCGKPNDSSCDQNTIAWGLTVKDLTNPELLRKVLLKIETHFVETGKCVHIERWEREESADERGETK